MPRHTIPAAQLTGTDLVEQSPPDVLAQAQELETAAERADAIAQSLGFARFSEEALDYHMEESRRLATQGFLGMARVIAAWVDGRGATVDWLCTRYGLARSTTHQLLRVARAVKQRPKLLEIAAQTSQGNVLELISMPPDELDRALAGEVEGLEPDEIVTLTRSELAKRIKDLESQLQTANEIVEAKDKKINDLDRRARSWARAAPTEQAIEILKDGSLALADVASACSRLEAALVAALDAAGPDVPAEVLKRVFDIKDQAESCIDSITARLAGFQGD
jgi:hypothetical protein